MASFSSPIEHRDRAGTALRSRSLAAVLFAALAGCGGVDDTPPAPASGTPLVIAEAQLAPVSKPTVGGDTAVSEPAPTIAGKPPVSTAPAAVPVVSGKVRYGTPSAAVPGAGGSLLGAVPFPQDDLWNRDVSQGGTDPASAALIARIGATAPLRLGFGRTEGVPYVVVSGAQPTRPLRTPDGQQRDWPVPAEATVSQDGSGRLVVLDRDAGRLFELHGAARAADGAWTADGATAWSLEVANGLPLDTSPLRTADSGIPMFAGLLRADEAAAGVIRHALRVTVPWLRDAWLPPARRALAGAADASLPPLGLRLRLKPGVVIPDTLSMPARAILQALKTYGMIVVGTGPAWTIEGAPDPSWDTVRLAGELAMVRGADFDVLPMDGLVIVR